MLQTKVNHFRNLCKVALLIPTSVLFLVVFAEKSYAQEVEKQKEVSPSQPSGKYKIMKVQGVSLRGKGEKTTVTLTDEAGNEIVEQITNKTERQAFTKKYGLQLPPPPPPPPSAIRVKKAVETPPPPPPPAPSIPTKKVSYMELPVPPPPPVPVKEK